MALNVTLVNDAPTISGGSPLSVAEGGTTGFAAAVTVGSGFTQSQLGLADVDTSAVQATIKIAGLPAHGTLNLNGNPVRVGSTLSVADIDKLSYTHNGTQVIGATSDTFLDDHRRWCRWPVDPQPDGECHPDAGESGTQRQWNNQGDRGETGVRLRQQCSLLPTIGGSRGAISGIGP